MKDWTTVAFFGAVQGAILGGCLVVYYFAWRPLKSKLDARREAHKIENDGLPPLVVAAAKGDDDSVDKLLGDGADINAAGKAGQTALIMAARNDNRSTVRLLLAKGADPSRKTAAGNTAWDVAKRYNHHIMCDMLSGRI